MRCKHPGFTLVELLVVIGIIGVLVALLLPAVQAAREAARRMSCSNNIRQQAIAVHNFHDTFKRLPYNGDPISLLGCCSPDTRAEWSWLARCLPFMEQQQLYDKANIMGNAPLRTPANQPIMNTLIATFRCPSDDTPDELTNRSQFGGIPYAGTSYKGVAGGNWAWGNFAYNPLGVSNNGLDAGNGVFYRSDVKGGKRSLAIITDGTSNTLMIGEDIASLNVHSGWAYSNHATGTCAIPLNVGVPSGSPVGINSTPGNWVNVYSFRSRHPGGAQFALADGSVRFITDTIELQVYRDAASVSGGEPIVLP